MSWRGGPRGRGQSCGFMTGRLRASEGRLGGGRRRAGARGLDRGGRNRHGAGAGRCHSGCRHVGRASADARRAARALVGSDQVEPPQRVELANPGERQTVEDAEVVDPDRARGWRWIRLEASFLTRRSSAISTSSSSSFRPVGLPADISTLVVGVLIDDLGRVAARARWSGPRGPGADSESESPGSRSPCGACSRTPR